MDLTYEDRERSNSRWPPAYPAYCLSALNFGSGKTVEVSFPTKLRGAHSFGDTSEAPRPPEIAYREKSRSNYIKFLIKIVHNPQVSQPNSLQNTSIVQCT